MFELLVIVIGVLVLAVLVLAARTRRSGGDPSSSVQDFHRALSAMEPGAQGGDRGEADDEREAEDASASSPPQDGPPPPGTSGDRQG